MRLGRGLPALSRRALERRASYAARAVATPMRGVAKLMRCATQRYFVAERYWTIVAEFEVESLEAFEKMMSGQNASTDAETLKKMDELMKGYHDLVEFGRREVYKLEN
jgi:hypothetical protein